MTEVKLITSKTLKKWDACTDGFKRFVELFPKGADLKTASEGLITDGHGDWANWLWQKCYADDEYKNQTVVSAGDRGTASAGDLGTASAGDLGTASAGDRGTASAGYRGTASAGDLGTASAGDLGTASAGYRGTARTGKNGAIVIQYYDGREYRLRAGEVGRDGIEPETWYKLDDAHNFVKVPNEEVEQLLKEREEERKNG